MNLFVKIPQSQETFAEHFGGTFCGAGSSLFNKPGQFTVENVQNAAVHEGAGHLKGGIPGTGTEHGKAYQMQMHHSTWKNTTKEWKGEINKAYRKVKAGEL